MSTEEDIIIEEEVKENGEVKAGQNNFTKKLGNALRRSKRLMSGKKRQHSKEESFDKENAAPNKIIQECETTDAPRIEVTDTNGDIEGPKQRKASQTFFSSEKQIEIDGLKIKEVEVTGEKSPEPVDMKKQKKLVRKKSLDQTELNVPCRDLGKADYEGWLLKKSGGHGLVPVSWKRYWCVIKAQKLYCYKTSFDMAAEYLISIQSYTVEHANEKKKTAFRLKPETEDLKVTVFAGESVDDINSWIEIINKVLSGVDISHKDDNEIPEYEDRKRMYSSAMKPEDHAGRKRQSTAFPAETETTGMPAGFGARTSSTSQPRVRKTSAGGAPPASCLAVGSMFKKLEEPNETETPTEEDVQLKDLLYEEVDVTPSDTPEQDRKKQEDLEKLNAEIEKLNSDMLVLNKNGERKPGNESTPEPAKKFTMPTEVIEPPKVQIQREEKDLVAEKSVQLEVKDDSSDKKTTSQLFNDLEIVGESSDTTPAAGEKAAMASVESSEDEVLEAPKNGIEIVVTETKEDSEVTPTVAPRESTEIDAETVITELEEQTKKDEVTKLSEEKSEDTSDVPLADKDRDEEVLVTTTLVAESSKDDENAKEGERIEAESASEPTETKENIPLVVVTLPTPEDVSVVAKTPSVNETSAGIEEINSGSVDASAKADLSTEVEKNKGGVMTSADVATTNVVETNVEVETTDIERVETEAGDVETTDIERVETEAGDVETTDIERVETEAGDVETTDIERVETEAGDVETTDIERVETEAGDVETTDIERVETEAGDVETTDIERVETEAGDVETTDIERVETEAGDVATQLEVTTNVERTETTKTNADSDNISTEVVESSAEFVEQPKVDAQTEQSKVDLQSGQSKVDVQAEPKVDIQPEQPKVDVQPEQPKVDVQQEQPKVDVQAEPKVDVQPEQPKVDVQAEPKVDVQTERIAPFATKDEEEDGEDKRSMELGSTVVETTENNDKTDSEKFYTNNEGNNRLSANLTSEGKKSSLDLGEELDIPSLGVGDSSLTDDINNELNLSGNKNNSVDIPSTQPNGHVAEV